MQRDNAQQPPAEPGAYWRGMEVVHKFRISTVGSDTVFTPVLVIIAGFLVLALVLHLGEMGLLAGL